MAKQKDELWDIRAKQCLAEIDAFLKEVERGGAPIPQSLRDAVESFRETLKEGK